MSLADIVNEMDVYNRSGDVSDNLLGLGDDGKLFGLVGDEHTRQYGGRSKGRKLVWSHVSQLSDDFIERYLRLDNETNNKFAELAEKKNGLFESDDLPTILHPEVYFNELGDVNGRLFLDILRNPKKIKPIKEYMLFVNKSKFKNREDYSLRKFLNSNDYNGFYRFDFVSGKSFILTGKNLGEDDNLFKSLSFGLDVGLVSEFRDALSLRSVRERIIGEYVLFVNNSDSKKVIDYGLPKFLNSNGYMSFYQYDFASNHQFQKAGKNRGEDDNLFRSLSFGLDGGLVSGFRDALSLRSVRERIVGEYVSFVNNSDSKKREVYSLCKFLKSNGYDNFYRFDFVSGKQFQKAGKKSGEDDNLFKSITYRLDDKLVNVFADVYWRNNK